MGVLHAIEGPLRGRVFGIPDKARLIVGRYEIYDVVVPEPSISRKHFVLERRADGLYVIDLGSLNGTQLNGQRISTARLEHGDQITAGQSVLCYDETDSPVPPVASADEAGLAVLEDEPLEELTDDDIVEIEPAGDLGAGIEVVDVTGDILDVPDEILELPDLDEPSAGIAASPPPTVPMKTANKRDAIRRKRLKTDFGNRKTLRVTKKGPSDGAQVGPADSRRGSARKKQVPAAAAGPSGSKRGSARRRQGAAPPPVASGPAVGKCAACGRGISQEEMNAGEGAQTRKGYLCGRCVSERQTSNIKGLDQFIQYKRKQRG
jgi:predicted component of type VI protein secretion system